MPYVFVYGPDSLQARMYDRLGPCDALGGASVEGYRLAFNKPDMKSDGGLCNLSKAPGESAFGVLYDLTRKQIEMLEGYYGGNLREEISAKLLPLPEGKEVEPELASRRPSAPVNATAYMLKTLSGKGGKLFLFAVLAIVCGAAAAYMAVVQHMPVTDMRVVAPAIGALWFGLRVFMHLAPKV